MIEVNKIKITINPDKAFVEEMREALTKNNNFCPCQIRKNEDDLSTKCICESFRNSKELGPCYCNLYNKIEV